jgi:hypothetical protein
MTMVTRARRGSGPFASTRKNARRSVDAEASPFASWPDRGLWIAAFCILGFGIPSFFVGTLHWRRALFLVPYVAGVMLLIGRFCMVCELPLRQLLAARWRQGLLGGIAAGILLAASVFRGPTGPCPRGGSLLTALFWFGGIYGVSDALFLTVAPVLIVDAGGRARGVGRLGVAAVALVASLTVVAAYHLGFPEFRGAALAGPLIGNAVVTLSYLATRSPVAPITAHVAMHVAAVLHGMESAPQLPPHYS